MPLSLNVISIRSGWAARHGDNAVRQLAILIHYEILDMDGRRSVDEPLDQISSRARLPILKER